MKATAIRRSRCVCTECEPLPPIEGLHPLTHEPDAEAEASKSKGFLGIIAEHVMPLRRLG
ncbi:hypothetical protein ACVITL_002756 [Rhizobium pisi]|uniref:Uncharacterized protein n=1 Tax=Rhizobium fabae TaxID=573179 RepID=A0A7W6B5N9_9HYPH|nr:hypothetical protein [Rhizobium fabae]MBB3914368.1 hypothetical protein [Rhizobium fabae]RUM15862.1 hypothetical protein EFB14_00505 [Rhizobium fabae]